MKYTNWSKFDQIPGKSSFISRKAVFFCSKSKSSSTKMLRRKKLILQGRLTLSLQLSSRSQLLKEHTEVLNLGLLIKD